MVHGTRTSDGKPNFVHCFVFPCSGAFYSGVCDVPEEAMPLYHGRSGSRQGTAQKRPATPGDVGHHAGLPTVLCWVSYQSYNH